MTGASLSEEQSQLLSPLIRVVEAGPGSGKTRALVQRFVEAAESAERGVALLSFTNAAIDEVRRRTVDRAHVLAAPHFVGTIDSFLHRFVVSPVEIGRLRRSLSYRGSWDELPEALRRVRLKGYPGEGIPLSAFVIESDGRATCPAESLRSLERLYLTQVTRGGHLDQLLHAGRQRIETLNARGVYDSTSARRRAAELLRGEAGRARLLRLAMRFEQVLVDEAQDCDISEFRILWRLAQEGVTTLVVADPDQAIFEFRGGGPDIFCTYRDHHESSTVAGLTRNFRSTTPICGAVSSLRVVANTAITSAESGDAPPVYVLGGTADRQRSSFLDLLTQHDIAVEEAVVLAHERAQAHGLAGVPLLNVSTQAAGNLLALRCRELSRAGRGADERLADVKAMERIILSLIDWPTALQGCATGRLLEELDRDRQWLREVVATVVAAFADCHDAESFGVAMRERLSAALTGLPREARVKGRLARPSPETWERCTARELDASEALRASTVHGAKGLEFDAVLLHVGRGRGGSSALEDWENERNTEARRVLYVGASRARRLLAFAAGKNASRVTAILERADVQCEGIT